MIADSRYAGLSLGRDLASYKCCRQRHAGREGTVQGKTRKQFPKGSGPNTLLQTSAEGYQLAGHER